MHSVAGRARSRTRCPHALDVSGQLHPQHIACTRQWQWPAPSKVMRSKAITLGREAPGRLGVPSASHRCRTHNPLEDVGTCWQPVILGHAIPWKTWGRVWNFGLHFRRRTSVRRIAGSIWRINKMGRSTAGHTKTLIARGGIDPVLKMVPCLR